MVHARRMTSHDESCSSFSVGWLKTFNAMDNAASAHVLINDRSFIPGSLPLLGERFSRLVISSNARAVYLFPPTSHPELEDTEIVTFKFPGKCCDNSSEGRTE